MQEILGAELDKAFAELGINAQKAYEQNKRYYAYEEVYQVWELTDEDFERFCEIDNSDWHNDWGWWRWSKGSVMGNATKRYNINNHYLKAWDGAGRKDQEKENKDLPVNDRYITPKNYEYLTQYFCDEMGASQPRNVCALAVDLAKQNGMTMAELFKKYQG